MAANRSSARSISRMAEQAATDRLRLAKQFGAAVIALTIDEVGMAKTVEDKLRITRRLVDFACVKHGTAQSGPVDRPADLHPSPPAMRTIRKLALWTLEGIAAIRAGFPEIPDHPWSTCST